MNINLFTLSFEPALETQFRQNYFNKSINQVRTSLCLAIFFYAFFGILDAELVPDQKVIFWGIRFGIFCPIAILVLIISCINRFMNTIQYWIALVEIVGGVGIICMTAVAPPPANYTYYAGLILVLFFGFTVFRLRFVLASITAWIIVVLYQIAAIYSETPLLMLINNNFFFIGANLVGMYACYSRELNERTNFYLTQLLDIERKKVNDANHALEDRVKERTLQLEKTNTNLLNEIEANKRAEKEKLVLESELRQAQKMQAIGTLAGGIAHDFNNILFPIFAYVQMAINDTSENPKLQRYLKRVMSSAERAKDLVQQILMFARKGDQEKSPLYIQPVIKEALKLLRASIPTNIEIKHHIQEKSSPISGSAIQLHQVIMNLCTNAYHAILEKETGCIDITVKELIVDDDNIKQYPNATHGEYICLIVKDTGIGMNENIREQIFDPFFTTKEPGEGTGLGLSVVHGIINDHDGYIYVHSDMGTGTRFSVLFPCIKDDVKPPPKRPLSLKNNSNKGSGEHILLVDDEPDVANALKQMLKKLGYKVTSNVSSQKTLEIFEKDPHAFDLLLTDQSMPQITGLSLAKKVLAIRPDLPIIISSGYSNQLTQEKIDDIGIKAVIIKPITLKELGDIVKRCISRKK